MKALLQIFDSFESYIGEIKSDFKDVIAGLNQANLDKMSPEIREKLRLKALAQINKAKNNKTEHKKQNLKKATYNLCLLDFLPYKNYHSKYQVFENDNTIGFVLKVSHFNNMGTKERAALKNLIENDLPTNYLLQIINYASPRIGNFIDYWKSSGSALGILGKISEARADFLKSGNWQSILKRRNFILRDYELYFCISCVKSNFSDLNELYLETYDLQEKIVESLKGINSYVEVLCPKELANFLQEILNPSCSLYKNYNQQTKINTSDYLTSSQTLEMKLDKVVISNVVAETISPQQTPDSFHYVVLEAVDYPETWQLNDSGEYIGDFVGEFSFPCPFYISFGYILESREQSIRSADKQRLIMTKQGESKLPMFFPAMHSEIEDRHYVSGKLAQGERLGRAVMYVVLIMRDACNEDKYATSVIAHFARLGVSLMRIRYDILNNLIHSLPFGMNEGWQNLLQQRLPSKKLSSACMNLMPVFGDIKIVNNPLMIFSGRKGELFFFDNYKTATESNGNYNMIVVGKSGSGKSVFLEEYTINSLRVGGQVVIIDDGRSFENPCLAYGGDFVDFGGGSFCINPFSLYRVRDENEASDEYQEYFEEPFIDLIVSILCILINLDKNDNKNPENGLYLALMRNAVAIVMKHKGSDGGFADIRDELLHNPELRTKQTADLADRIAFVLKSYADGRDKNYFNGPATISITNFLSVFEFSDLEHNELLQNSVLLVLVFLVYNKMRKRERRTSLIIDEAWRLLKHPAMKGFIAGIARRARKYDGCLIVATQTMSDFDKSESEAAATVLSQSTWRVMLSVDDGDHEVLKTKLGMNMREIEIAASMSGIKGSYSEVMIRHSSGSSMIGRLLLDKFSAKLYSTTAGDVRALNKLKDTGISISDAIESLL